METQRAVLVLTGADDPTAGAVVAELDRRGVPVTVMDTGDFPTRIRLAAHHDRSVWRGRLDTLDGAGIALEQITAIYYWRPTRFRMPAGISDADAALATVEARYGLGGALASVDALWVNDPMKIAVAEYKPLQLRVAADVGLAVPRTLISNDHRAAARFAAEIGGPVVCKTLSSVVLAEDGVPRITYTTLVDVARIDPAQFAVTTHLLQEWVPKRYDARVTMVGDHPFAVAIEAGSALARVDWRADYANVSYRTITPPDEVVAGMRRYLDHFGLRFGAFDFVVSETGWVALECNPSGEWLWLAKATGLPMLSALVDLLAGEGNS